MEDWNSLKEWRKDYFRRYINAKTAVFWDLQDCRIPDGFKAGKIAQNIRSALVGMNYHGEVSIYAYGDRDQFLADLEPTLGVEYHKPSGDSAPDHAIMDYRPRASIYESHDDRASPLFVFNQTPAEDKDARLEILSADILNWAFNNPSPAVNVILIVGDISEHVEFSFIFNCLQYNFLLAQPENASSPPTLPSKTKLLWESLSLGSIARVKRNRSPLGGGSLASPVGSGSLASPVDIGSLASPVDSGSLASPVGGGSLASPVGSVGFFLAGIGVGALGFAWLSRRYRYVS